VTDDIVHDQEQKKFSLFIDGKEALLTYTICEDGIIDFTHTFVPPELRGGNRAARLAEAALRFAVDNGYRIKATCSYIKNYIRSHPRYQTHWLGH